MPKPRLRVDVVCENCEEIIHSVGEEGKTETFNNKDLSKKEKHTCGFLDTEKEFILPSVQTYDQVDQAE